MKAVVFGGSGFLGSHTADELTGRGYDVTIFDIKDSPYRNQKQKMIVGSILDQKKVEKVVKGKDFVYNFAALADIEDIAPIQTVKDNILGNTIVLESCRKNKIKRFVFASTIYVYSNKGSFYRSSKHACESIIENYNEIFDLSYTILRYGSLYGQRANEHNWVHKILKQALTEGKITRRGDGEEIREYIYVKDAASLSVDILSDEFKNQIVNITGNQPMKIKDLHTMVKEIIGKKIKIEYLSANDWESHYKITPYSFKPKTAKKLVSTTFHDMGQGILECLSEIYEEING